jgi:electron transfer flavoprotein beta subunit
METDVTSGPLTVIVCVKYTVDVEEIRIDPRTREPDLDRVSYRINDFDENGIETAVQIRDGHGGRAVAVCVLGERPADEMLLRVLAAGIDELHMVCDPVLRDCDALATATILAALIRKLGSFDLVVCGDISVDENRGEVGPRLAEIFGIPAITHVTDLTLNGGRLRANRALDGWLETDETALPVLLTVSSETNQPRLPAWLQIVRARKRPVVEWCLADLVPAEIYNDSASRISTLATYGQPTARKRVIVDGDTPAEMSRRLVRYLLADGVITF